MLIPYRLTGWDVYFYGSPLSHILQHAQQGLRNPVSQPKIQGFTPLCSQETRFLGLVQDLSYSTGSRAAVLPTHAGRFTCSTMGAQPSH